MKVRKQLKQSCHDRSNLWWNNVQRLVEGYGASFDRGKKTLSPFVLKHVTSIGTSCSKCPWSSRCYGCVIQPYEYNEDKLRKVLLRNTYIACEWDFEFLDENLDE